MDREALQELWTSWWDGDIWIAPWSKALADLTADQAAAHPIAGRHSIWQLLHHVLFWREATFRHLAGEPGPNAEEIAACQFAEPQRIDEAAWAATQAAVRSSHDRILAVLADKSVELERLRFHLVHDAYHLGQIAQLRGVLGVPVGG